ncbi:hypothetical protein SK128_000604, partial [Halocaridina rubra]
RLNTSRRLLNLWHCSDTSSHRLGSIRMSVNYCIASIKNVSRQQSHVKLNMMFHFCHLPYQDELTSRDNEASSFGAKTSKRQHLA